MNKKRFNRTIRIDSDTLEKIKRQSRELSVIENRGIPNGEVVGRVFKGEDIPERLRLGAKERRRMGII